MSATTHEPRQCNQSSTNTDTHTFFTASANLRRAEGPEDDEGPGDVEEPDGRACELGETDLRARFAPESVAPTAPRFPPLRSADGGSAWAATFAVMSPADGVDDAGPSAVPDPAPASSSIRSTTFAAASAATRWRRATARSSWAAGPPCSHTASRAAGRFAQKGQPWSRPATNLSCSTWIASRSFWRCVARSDLR